MIALVLGGAECVFSDADAAFELFKPDAVYACNDIGARWPGPVDVWCTLHPEKMKHWIAQRYRRGHPPVREVVAPPLASPDYLHGVSRDHRACYRVVDRIVDYKFLANDYTPLSGLYTAKVARDDGYRVVLCGVPMTKDGGHFVRKREWDDPTIGLALRDAIPSLRPFARSMSGATRHALGAPTKEWIDGEDRSRACMSLGDPVADPEGAGRAQLHQRVHPRPGTERHDRRGWTPDARDARKLPQGR